MKTQSDLLRELGRKYGFNHSNGYFCDLMWKKYGLEVVPQLVQKLFGVRKLRKYLNHNHILNTCRKFLTACQSDYDLARRVLLNESSRRKNL